MEEEARVILVLYFVSRRGRWEDELGRGCQGSRLTAMHQYTVQEVFISPIKDQY